VPRCPFAKPLCSQVPAELVEVTPGRSTRCVRFQREHRGGVWTPTPERAADVAEELPELVPIPIVDPQP